MKENRGLNFNIFCSGLIRQSNQKTAEGFLAMLPINSQMRWDVVEWQVCWGGGKREGFKASGGIYRSKLICEEKKLSTDIKIEQSMKNKETDLKKKKIEVRWGSGSALQRRAKSKIKWQISDPKCLEAISLILGIWTKCRMFWNGNAFG